MTCPKNIGQHFGLLKQVYVLNQTKSDEKTNLAGGSWNYVVRWISGRILVSKELREFAGLQKQAMLIGQCNKFELWDEATWNEKRDAWLSEDDDGELPPDLESIAF